MLERANQYRLARTVPKSAANSAALATHGQAPRRPEVKAAKAEAPRINQLPTTPCQPHRSHCLELRLRTFRQTGVNADDGKLENAGADAIGGAFGELLNADQIGLLEPGRTV